VRKSRSYEREAACYCPPGRRRWEFSQALQSADTGDEEAARHLTETWDKAVVFGYAYDLPVEVNIEGFRELLRKVGQDHARIDWLDGQPPRIMGVDEAIEEMRRVPELETGELARRMRRLAE
jgi:hypothetical protein